MSRPEGPEVKGPGAGGGAELIGVTAGYGETEVVRGVSLEAPMEAVTVVTGPGGGGKTTLLRVLGDMDDAGLWWQGERRLPWGEVVFQGQLTDLESERRGIADLLRGHGGPEALYGKLRWLPGAPLEEAGAFLRRPPETWKRGEMQAFRFLLTLASPASLYLIDEPEVDVSQAAMEWMVPGLRHLARSASVVVVTHNLKLVRAVADRIAILDLGELLVAGEAAEVLARPGHERAGDFLRMGS